jgi:hypothetical protein
VHCVNYQSLKQALGKILTDPDSFKGKAKDADDTQNAVSEVVNELIETVDTNDTVAERVIRVSAEKLNKVITESTTLSKMSV